MKDFKYILNFFLMLVLCVNANAQQDPNNLFLVEVENEYNTDLVGKLNGMPNVGDRSLSAEEVLMYQILNCKWENGKWIRYTANPNGKGTIKVGHPFLQTSANRLFFVSNIPGGAGGFDVYYSEKKNGKWSDPTNMGLKVNSPEDELFPFVTDAGVLQVYRNSTQVNFDLSEILGAPASIVNQSKPVSPTTQTPVVAPTTPTTSTNTAKPIPVDVPKTPTTAPVESTPETTPIKNVSTEPTNGKEYRVQIGSFSKPNWTVLNQLSDLGSFKTVKTSTGLTSVHLGAFNSLSEATNLLKKVRMRAGFENAYIVEVENDKVIGVHK